MNEISVKRLLVAGIVTFVVWIATEIVVEQVVGRLLFGSLIDNLWAGATDVRRWGAFNHVLNILLALLSSTLLIWLYAALRPMYGVGTRTALIASALCVVWGLVLDINGINLGLFPLKAGLVEAAFEAVECPIALVVGARAYEGLGRGSLDSVVE
jgi:hypothetical protein